MSLLMIGATGYRAADPYICSLDRGYEVRATVQDVVAAAKLAAAVWLCSILVSRRGSRVSIAAATCRCTGHWDARNIVIG